MATNPVDTRENLYAVEYNTFFFLLFSLEERYISIVTNDIDYGKTKS